VRASSSSSNLLGRHIGDRASVLPGLVRCSSDSMVAGAHGNACQLQRHFGEPEIENLRCSRVGHEDVRRLYISMNDTLRMRRI